MYSMEKYTFTPHDIEAGDPFNDNGDHFGMEDYHVISMDTITSEARIMV
jgi:hypothetical protein